MAKSTGKLKAKKKKWYSLVSPDFLGHKTVAELLSEDISKLVGQKVTLNLMQVTKDFHHQDSNVMFKIVGTSGQTLKSKFIRFSTSLSSIKRNARRRRDRIDMRTEFVTKDDISVYLKVVLITQRNTTRLIRSEIQKVVLAYLKEISKNKNFTVIANDIIRNRLQRDLVPKVKKIYPVKSIIIREYGIKDENIEVEDNVEDAEVINVDKKEAQVGNGEKKNAEDKNDVKKVKEEKNDDKKEVKSESIEKEVKDDSNKKVSN